MCQAVALAVTTLGTAQQSAPPFTVTWLPALPQQGALVGLLVVPSARDGDSTVTVHGELAGEPLHFEALAGGGFRALGGVPLDAPDTIAVQLVLRRASGGGGGGGVEAAEARAVVTRRPGPVERVRTAPQFAREPDSALVARIRTERALAREAAYGAHDVPRLWAEPFLRPRAGRVTSPFGARREVNRVPQGRHSGEDLAGPAGAPVRAANRGVVALIGDFYYGGISVYLHHGAGLLTAYHHLSRAVVAVGDTVERGAVIGRVGATGRVTGPHLHWEAQYGRVAVDPQDLLTLLAAPPD